MSTHKIRKLKYLVVLFLSQCTLIYGEKSQPPLPSSKYSIPARGDLSQLQGEIKGGRYHAPKGIFSCKALDFGTGEYSVEGEFVAGGAFVTFYTSEGNSVGAMLTPFLEPEKLNVDRTLLKELFDSFMASRFIKGENALGMKVLEEEMMDKNTYFVSVSFERSDLSRTLEGKYVPSTLGILVFTERDMLTFLFKRVLNLPQEKNRLNERITKVKSELLDYRKTFVFGSFPGYGDNWKKHKSPHIEMISSSPKSGIYKLKISGFPPNEKIHISSKSAHELLEYDLEVPASGNIISLFEPVVLGVVEGDVKLTAKGKEGREASIEFHWYNPELYDFKNPKLE